MTELSDHELFLKVKDGDLGAYETLFRKYYAALTRYATSIVRDHYVGEEIAQEIYMYIWEKRSQINLSTGIKSYLFSSVKNKCINYVKLELPKLKATTDLAGVEGHSSMEVNVDDTKMIKRKIQWAIDQLPDKCREIFVLSRYAGLTYKEIAEELDVSVKTVENQMTIALKKLKDTLSDELKNYGIRSK